MVRGNQLLLELAILNLMDNAMKYSTDIVNVVLDGNYRRTTISVIDNGMGIPEAEIDKIFNSFYRIDKARSREMGGTGLGLTIVKKIIDAHKGNINVFSSIKSGTIFKIDLPRYVEY